MGGIQTILTIGALMLLSGVMLSLNNAVLTRDVIQYESEATLTATSLAQSLLEEARTRSFDEQTVPPKTVETPSSLTSAGNLGAETGEVITEDFDDVDDYNGFVRIVTTPRFGDYEQRVGVYYVRNGSLQTPLTYQTYLKRVDVTVWNPYIGSTDQTITLSTVIAYR